MADTYTTPQIIYIAKISQQLAQVDIMKKGLFGGGMDVRLPRKIYMIRQNVEWLYDLDSTDTTLLDTGRYLLAICGKYAMAAAVIMNSGTGGGTAVVPATPFTFDYLIPITSSDFATATTYNDTRIVGKGLAIFWNDIPRYIIEGSEWALTATGIEILIPGFDATTTTYTFYIYIIDP